LLEKSKAKVMRGVYDVISKRVPVSDNFFSRSIFNDYEGKK
jgi:hypothetical protein